MEDIEERRPCPHCETVVETCSCGIWDCAYYTHLFEECSSEAGMQRRREAKARHKRRQELLTKKIEDEEFFNAN